MSCARGEEQHRRIESSRTQDLAHVASVRVRQTDVEDDRVDVRRRHAQRAGAVRRGDDVVVLGAQRRARARRAMPWSSSTTRTRACHATQYRRRTTTLSNRIRGQVRFSPRREDSTVVTHHLSWLEAGVIGALQGVSELFPVSSLGHSVLAPRRGGRIVGTRPRTSAHPSRRTSRSSSVCTWRPRWRWSCTSGATGCASSAGCHEHRPARGAHVRPAAGLAADPRDDPGRHRRAGRRALVPDDAGQTGPVRRLPGRERSRS